jgi:5-methylcytosine-specific restriction endonuclease McrA
MRDEFSPKTIDELSKRASFICSNPQCRCLTLAPSNESDSKYILTGKAAHITAASPGGPRYDPSLSHEQRSSISNGVYLCANCADKIDKNRGLDFPLSLIMQWKQEHEAWVRENLNKTKENMFVIVDGRHIAKGQGEVTALDIESSAAIKPGTVAFAEGSGKVTATRIHGKARQ